MSTNTASLRYSLTVAGEDHEYEGLRVTGLNRDELATMLGDLLGYKKRYMAQTLARRDVRAKAEEGGFKIAVPGSFSGPFFVVRLERA